jgi:carboxylesterase type B
MLTEPPRIHGGGYTAGSKGDFYDPTGLIGASRADGGVGIIYVAINYRLGAFGWLAGRTLQSNGTANAGLYDQMLAVDWIRQNIHLFGGDPERITLMGESAGGGSIMYLMTAFGGAIPASFQQVILQSPGFTPVASSSIQEATLQGFLTQLGVRTIEEARELPSNRLIAANAAQIGMLTPYFNYMYWPVVDGSLVPDVPGKLLLQGAFDHTIKVMAGHNSNEGVLFTDARIVDDAALAALIRRSFPEVQDSVTKFITQTLYPAVYDGSQPYLNGLERTILLISELIITCNTNFVARAYMNETYNYQFSVPPSLHGADIPYTFYNGGQTNLTLEANATVAAALQEYLTSFAQNGVPSAKGFPSFPTYGPSATELNLNISGIAAMKDPTDNPRCLYWQKALYL